MYRISINIYIFFSSSHHDFFLFMFCHSFVVCLASLRFKKMRCETEFFCYSNKDIWMWINSSQKQIRKNALAGNRTRVARVASEHSTTEPPVLGTNSIENTRHLDYRYIRSLRTDGSMVECSLPTRVTRVRFPVSAMWILFFQNLSLYFNTIRTIEQHRDFHRLNLLYELHSLLLLYTISLHNYP